MPNTVGELKWPSIARIVGNLTILFLINMSKFAKYMNLIKNAVVACMGNLQKYLPQPNALMTGEWNPARALDFKCIKKLISIC